MSPKRIISVLMILPVLFGCAREPERAAGTETAGGGNGISAENPYITLPVIDAYYDGEVVWFLHTEASDRPMSERLTEMVDYQTLYAPRLSAVPAEAAGKIYVFTNGINREGTQPWGGGPFHFQIDVFDSVPGDRNYTPLRNPHMVAWREGVEPRVLRSEEEILEAERNGQLTIQPTPVVVNAPIVQWPGVLPAARDGAPDGFQASPNFLSRR